MGKPDIIVVDEENDCTIMYMLYTWTDNTYTSCDNVKWRWGPEDENNHILSCLITQLGHTQPTIVF